MSDVAQEPSAAFGELMSLLGDPHRHEVGQMWAGVVASELGPEDRATAERMAPVVRRYLAKETDRETYERELAAATVPTVSDIPATG